MRNIGPHPSADSLDVLIYSVTNRCNAACAMCHKHKIRNNDIRDEITAAEIQKLCTRLKRLKIFLCTGGEPFVRDDIFEILDSFASISKVVSVATNGCFPDRTEDIFRRLLANNRRTLFRVSVSLHGLADVHNAVTNIKGGFALAEDTVRRVQLLAGKYKNLMIVINTTLTSTNVKDIEEFIGYVSTMGIDDHIISFMWGEGKDSTLRTSIQTYKKVLIYRYAKKYRYRNKSLYAIAMRALNKLNDIHMLKYMESGKSIFNCKALKKFAFMEPNGDIKPCYKINEVMGNVKDNDYDIRYILQNNMSRRTVEKIEASGCQCDIICCNKINLAYSANTPLFLLKNIDRIAAF